MFFLSLMYSRSRRPSFLVHRNADAERDCTTVLVLSAFNVKALFRRGQARVGMGKLDEARQGGSAASV
jgi:RNA polymerase II-associated protein 3